MTSEASSSAAKALISQASGGDPLEMEARQCRAARGLLGLTQKELAELAGVSPVTLHGFETGATKPTRATLAVIRQALERAGVEFTNDDRPGVRMRKVRK